MAIDGNLMPSTRAHREKKTLIHVSALHYLLWFNSTAEGLLSRKFKENNTSRFPLPLRYNTVSGIILVCVYGV